jgi:hypothetical protein
VSAGLDCGKAGGDTLEAHESRGHLTIEFLRNEADVAGPRAAVDGLRRQLVMDALAPRFAASAGSTVIRLVDVGTGWRVVNAWTYRVDDEDALRAGASPATLIRGDATGEAESLLREAGLLAAR